METKPLDLARLYRECRDVLGLSLLSGHASLERGVSRSNIGRPGLALTGFTDGFEHGQVQVMERADILYLDGLSPSEVRARLRVLGEARTPGLIVAGGIEVPDHRLGLRREHPRVDVGGAGAEQQAAGKSGGRHGSMLTTLGVPRHRRTVPLPRRCVSPRDSVFVGE